jgi:hypothetical protein
MVEDVLDVVFADDLEQHGVGDGDGSSGVLNVSVAGDAVGLIEGLEVEDLVGARDFRVRAGLAWRAIAAGGGEGGS